jgi:hypothetical protein
LAEVIQREARDGHAGENGGVVDGMGGDGEGAGTEGKVGVGCCSGSFCVRVLCSIVRKARNEPERIANDEEGDVFGVGIGED